MGVMDRLGNGSISARALNRWLSSTSYDGQELGPDDGGLSDGGRGIGRDQLDALSTRTPAARILTITPSVITGPATSARSTTSSTGAATGKASSVASAPHWIVRCGPTSGQPQ